MTLPLAAGGGALALLLLAIALAATLLFQHAILAPMLQGMLAALISFFLLLGFRLMITDRDKRLIRQMFGLYLSPTIVEPMIEAGRLPALGGERREMSFLFSDVAGFTTLTEASDPTRLAPVLNQYFDGICQAVMRNRGLVVEFVGDGVLAFFGAPAPQDDHAACALACARDINQFTECFRATGEPAALGFGHTRIGVHMGEAVVGNFGGTRRFKYAALGDVVNATSRLEGLNKYFGTHICASEAVRNAARDPHVRLLGSFLMKGKHQPVAAFELLDEAEAHSEFMQRYAAAYRLLALGDHAAAAAAFRELQQMRPQDGCVSFYLQRLESGTTDALVVMADK
jgi:class 3 adenylate cyclase